MSTMELDDILRLSRLQCTGDKARAGWYLDQDAIIEAMDLLKIECPVKIRFMTGKYRQGTQYSTNVNHRITVDQNLPISQANATLWHELAHVMQTERFSRETGKPMKEFDAEYKGARGQWGETYRGNYYELEANDIEARYREDHLLLIPA